MRIPGRAPAERVDGQHHVRSGAAWACAAAGWPVRHPGTDLPTGPRVGSPDGDAGGPLHGHLGHVGQQVHLARDERHSSVGVGDCTAVLAAGAGVEDVVSVY